MNHEDALSLNPILSDRVRLAIMTALAASDEALNFTTMIDILKVSKGNFAGHMRKLEEAGMVEVLKDYLGRKPRTRYQITDQGRILLTQYLTDIEKILSSLC